MVSISSRRSSNREISARKGGGGEEEKTDGVEGRIVLGRLLLNETHHPRRRRTGTVVESSHRLHALGGTRVDAGNFAEDRRLDVL